MSAVVGSGIAVLFDNSEKMGISLETLFSLVIIVVFVAGLFLWICYMLEDFTPKDKYKRMLDILRQYRVCIQKDE